MNLNRDEFGTEHHAIVCSYRYLSAHIECEMRYSFEARFCHQLLSPL